MLICIKNPVSFYKNVYKYKHLRFFFIYFVLPGCQIVYCIYSPAEEHSAHGRCTTAIHIVAGSLNTVKNKLHEINLHSRPIPCRTLTRGNRGTYSSHNLNCVNIFITELKMIGR